MRNVRVNTWVGVTLVTLVGLGASALILYLSFSADDKLRQYMEHSTADGVPQEAAQ